MLLKEVFFLLDKSLDDIFPEITKKLLFDTIDHDELIRENIVFNLENNEWLVNYLSSQSPSISKSAIKKYVEESINFNNKIHEYQLKIAKFIINDYNVWSKGFLNIDGKLEYLTIESDYAFRKSLSDTFKYLGFSYDRSEEAIETFSKNWRFPRMKLQFYNGFTGDVVLVARETYSSHDPEFMENWLKIKEYDYYKKHKDSVDKYGSATPSMLMSDEEAMNLKNKLVILSDERKKDMESAKEHMTNEEKALMKILKRI